MSKITPGRFSGKELVRSFVLAAQRVKPHFIFQTDVPIVPGYSADVLASFGDSRIVVECMNSTSRERILDGLYRLVGAINLHPKAFNRVYIVVPEEASKLASVNTPERVGVISFAVDEQVRFHVLKGGRDFPNNFSASLPSPASADELGFKLVDVTAPKSFRIVRNLLEHPQMTQSLLAEEAEVSVGLVNKVVSYLSSKRIVEVSKKGVTLSEPWKLLSEVALARPMESLRVATIPTHLKEIELVEDKIRQVMQQADRRYVLGIFSAARRYSSYFSLNDAVQLYVDSLKAIPDLLDATDSSMNPKLNLQGARVEVYKADTPEIFSEAEDFENATVTSRVQTIIDLVCAGSKGYELATRLYEELKK